MHDDDKERRKQYRTQKRKVVESGNEQTRNLFDVVTMSMWEISRTDVQRKWIIEFQKEDVTTPDTPWEIGENDMVQDFLQIQKNDETLATYNLENNWRPKTK